MLIANKYRKINKDRIVLLDLLIQIEEIKSIVNKGNNTLVQLLESIESECYAIYDKINHY